MFFYLVVFLLCVSNTLCKTFETVARKEQVNYCSIASCDDPSEHVMCLYKDAEGEGCVKFQKDKGLSADDKSAILKAHNELRSAVAIGAMGETIPYGHRMKGSENMQEMYWDDELEMLAHRWAKQCKVYEKDKCRNTENYPTVGQVTFSKKWDPSRPLSYHVNLAFLEAGISNVYEFLNTTNAECISYTDQKNLAQIIWATADKLGCARTVFDHDPKMMEKSSDQGKGPPGRQNNEAQEPDDTEDPEVPEVPVEALEPIMTTPVPIITLNPDKIKNPAELQVATTELIVCNYNDGGQMRGNVYKSGPYCTFCFCSEVYPGLCGSADARGALRMLWIPATFLVWRVYKIH